MPPNYVFSEVTAYKWCSQGQSMHLFPIREEPLVHIVISLPQSFSLKKAPCHPQLSREDQPEHQLSTISMSPRTLILAFILVASLLIAVSWLLL